MPGIICVVPTVRPECHAQFVKAWTPLFEKHQVTLVTVWDGEHPHVTISVEGQPGVVRPRYPNGIGVDLVEHSDLFCRQTDACRNMGFVAAARMNPDYVLTLDDDVTPLDIPCANCTGKCVHKGYLEEGRADGAYRHVPCPVCKGTGLGTNDPIQSHLEALAKRVPISWMNTAHDTDLYLRGVPYGVRDEAPVMLSHGVWVGTPDFDGETQLRLENRMTNTVTGGVRSRELPYSLPYYVGPIPKGVNFPLCGMNVMVRKEALPYLYFAPMGPDSGVERLNRFSDIWMGVFLKREFDARGWACYTGASTVLHTRASDARKNFEQEKVGREWNEWMWVNNDLWEVPNELPPGMRDYCRSYADKRKRYADLITKLLEGGGS